MPTNSPSEPMMASQPCRIAASTPMRTGASPMTARRVASEALSNNSKQGTETTRAALIYVMEPVFAAALGYLILNEFLTGRQWLGAILILVAMVLSEIKFNLFNNNDNISISNYSCLVEKDITKNKNNFNKFNKIIILIRVRIIFRLMKNIKKSVYPKLKKIIKNHHCHQCKNLQTPTALHRDPGHPPSLMVHCTIKISHFSPNDQNNYS